MTKRGTLQFVSLRDALEIAYRIREQGNNVDSRRVGDTVAYGEVSTARLEPVGRQSLQRYITLRDFGALPRDMHNATLWYVPSREARLLGTEAKVRLFEIEEVLFVETTD